VCQITVYYSFQRESFLARIQHDDGRLCGIGIEVLSYLLCPSPGCDLAQYWHTIESSEEWLEIGGAILFALWETISGAQGWELKWRRLRRSLARVGRNLRREGWHSVADEFEGAEKEMKEWGLPVVQGNESQG
jgi:hypothetical protein